MKKAKYAVWEYMYWKRNRDPEIKIFCGNSVNFKKYCLDNFDSDPKIYCIDPEEIWYKVKDVHIEANHIFKDLCGNPKNYENDLVGIIVLLFSKKPEIGDKGYITRASWRYKVCEKHFMYNFGGHKNGS